MANSASMGKGTIRSLVSTLVLPSRKSILDMSARVLDRPPSFLRTLAEVCLVPLLERTMDGYSMNTNVKGRIVKSQAGKYYDCI